MPTTTDNFNEILAGALGHSAEEAHDGVRPDAPVDPNSPPDVMRRTWAQGTERSGSERLDSKAENAWSSKEDQSRQIPGMPPHFGQELIPHPLTFQGILSSIARVYRPSDEAIKDSWDNARFMLNDTTVLECIEQRQRSTALLDWHLEPDDQDDESQQYLCDKMTGILKATPRFMQYRECLMKAIWYGRYANRHRYNWKNIKGVRRVVVDEWRPVLGDKLVFRFDDGSGEYDPNQIGIRVGPAYAATPSSRAIRHDQWENQVEPTDWGRAYFLRPDERKMIAVHKHMIEDGEYEEPQNAGRIHGLGIRSRIYWTWYQKQEALAWLMEFLERSAFGIELWYYPYGNDQAKQKTREAAEERIGQGRNIILVPRPPGDEGMMYGVERVEVNMAGAEVLKEILEKYFGHQIKRYILGQTLTTEAESTGLGSNLASIHLDTYLQIIRYDATNLEETLTTDFVDPLKRFNFPKFAATPIHFKIETESPDIEGKLEAWHRAYSMGVRLPEKDVIELVGASLVEDGDVVLQSPEHKDAGQNADLERQKMQDELAFDREKEQQKLAIEKEKTEYERQAAAEQREFDKQEAAIQHEHDKAQMQVEQQQKQVQFAHQQEMDRQAAANEQTRMKEEMAAAKRKEVVNPNDFSPVVQQGFVPNSENASREKLTRYEGEEGVEKEEYARVKPGRGQLDLFGGKETSGEQGKTWNESAHPRVASGSSEGGQFGSGGGGGGETKGKGAGGITRPEAVSKAMEGSTRKAMSYDQSCHATYLYTGTKPEEWKAMGIKDFREVDTGKGGSQMMPEFDRPEGYKPVDAFFSQDAGEGGKCELCGHNIKNAYQLQNDSKKLTMAVGSECVTKFGEGKSGSKLAKEAKYQMDRDFVSEARKAEEDLKDWHRDVNNNYGGRSIRSVVSKIEDKDTRIAAWSLMRSIGYDVAGGKTTGWMYLTEDEAKESGWRGARKATDRKITNWVKKHGEKAREQIDKIQDFLKGEQKKESPEHYDRESAGWRTIGGASMHIGENGIIDAGCPGVKGEDPDDLTNESDESRAEREKRQDVAQSHGIQGNEVSAADARNLDQQQMGQVPTAENPATVNVSGHELQAMIDHDTVFWRRQGQREWMAASGGMSDAIRQQLPQQPTQQQQDPNQQKIAEFRAQSKGSTVASLENFYKTVASRANRVNADGSSGHPDGQDPIRMEALKQEIADLKSRSRESQTNKFDTIAEEVARDFNVDLTHLKEAAEDLVAEQTKWVRNRENAKKSARSTTGLTAGWIAGLENAGHDFSSAHRVGGVLGNRMREFDVKAEDVARQFPDLGLGEVGSGEAAPRLWNILREPAQRPPQPWDRDIMRQAAGIVEASAGFDPGSEELGQFKRQGKRERYAKWVESQHPRDGESGEFVEAGGGEGQSKPNRRHEFSDQDLGHRAWARNANRVAVDPEKASSQDLRRAAGFQKRVAEIEVRKKQLGESYSEDIIDGAHSEADWYQRIISERERGEKSEPSHLTEEQQIAEAAIRDQKNVWGVAKDWGLTHQELREAMPSIQEHMEALRNAEKPAPSAARQRAMDKQKKSEEGKEDKQPTPTGIDRSWQKTPETIKPTAGQQDLFGGATTQAEQPQQKPQKPQKPTKANERQGTLFEGTDWKDSLEGQMGLFDNESIRGDDEKKDEGPPKQKSLFRRSAGETTSLQYQLTKAYYSRYLATPMQQSTFWASKSSRSASIIAEERGKLIQYSRHAGGLSAERLA